MKYFDGVADRRQRVNLSDEAYGTIMSDSFSFAGNEAVISYSEIICRVFLNFVECALTQNNNSKRISELLSKMPSRAQQKTPSLRDGVLEHLKQSDVVDVINSVYGGSPGKLIKSVIEEYAEKPFTERELIYYRETVEKINANRDNKLRVVTGKQTLFVKPYAIMADKQSTYNYLVCFAAISTEPDTYKPSSLRISRIRSVSALPDSKFNFTIFEVDEIKNALSKKGVQFLRGELCNVVVELSDIGKQLYNTMLFQRPNVISTDGNTCRFYCTEKQADFYFFKFGAEAKIIEPISLRKEFMERYNQAVMTYKDAESRG